MKITLDRGYFYFREDEPGEVARFNTFFDQDLVGVRDYFTFSALEDVPPYTIAGGTLLNLPAVVTFEGQAPDVLEANGYVYDFVLKALVPIASVAYRINVTQGDLFWFADSLIVPASFPRVGPQKISGYNAHLDTKSMIFRYSEIMAYA